MTRASRSVEVRAHLIVGADGRRSGIAAAVGAEKYHRRPATTCNYYSYWSGFEISHPHLFVRDGQFAVAVPTNNGLTIINMAWPITAFHSVRADLERSFYAALARIPWLADRIPTAARAERFMGTADLEGYFRTAYGPGWALVGDAGYHRDPITAQGMTDAFLHAELLTHAISEGLNGRRPLDATLADYQRLRDNATMPMFDLTCDMALLAPPSPEMKTLIDALQSDTVATQRFMGVIAGTVRLDDFFAPANIERIVGARRAA